jgi:hypothetical protein
MLFEKNGLIYCCANQLFDIIFVIYDSKKL